MSSIDPRRPKWTPKEPRRPQDASDTSEESEDEYLRKAAPYEVRLQLGNIEYGQNIAYYEDNKPSITDITYLQRNQAFSDRSLFIKDKKGRVLKKIDKEKIEKRKEAKKKRFLRKKEEKVLERESRKKDLEEIVKKQKIEDLEMEQFGLPSKFGKFNDKEIESPVSSEGNSAGTHSSDYEDVADYPITHLVELATHTRPLTCVAINSKNTQMATCSLDYSVKHYDFTKMDATLQPFRSYEPIDGHPVRSVDYSLDDKHVLTCAGGIQIKIFSKEGRIHYESVKGDMYMSDMNNTHGHTGMVTHCAWHPFKPNFFGSSSLDSTFRVWDIAGRLVGVDRQMGHKTLHKARNKTYNKVSIDTFTWAYNGNLVAGGCSDGSIQFWDTTRGNSAQAKMFKYEAHSSEISSLKFFKDDLRLISRSLDGSVKLWDIRNMEKELQSTNLECCNYRIQVDLSPDEQYIITGTSPEDRDSESYLKVLNSTTLQELDSVPFPKPIIAVKWHKEFNQVFLGSADGSLKVLFSPQISSGGVLDCLKKVPKEVESKEYSISKPILTPFSLSQFRVSFVSKDKMHQRLREDPVASQKPKGPLFDPSFDGRMSGINTVTQYILSSIHAKPRPEDDPREALLSYAPESENPEWVNNAYSKTQPKALFDNTSISFPERDFLNANLEQKCRSCGLKFCLCPKRRTKDEPIYGIEK